MFHCAKSSRLSVPRVMTYIVKGNPPTPMESNMKTKIAGILIHLSLLLPLFGLFSCAGQPPKAGLVDGHLRPCPNSPNCLNSENSGPSAIAPLAYTSSSAVAWQNIKKTIEDSGGYIVDSQPGYLRAVYTSQLMQFVDDLELRLDESAGLIQIRSSSRLGFWDMGVNKRRVEQIRRLFSGRNERSGN